MKKILLLLPLLIAMSCSKEDFYLNVDPSTTTYAPSSGGIIQYNVKTTNYWYVEIPQESRKWLSVTPSSGEGNGIFHVAIEPNTSSSMRAAIIEVSAFIGEADPSVSKRLYLAIQQNGAQDNGNGGGNSGGDDSNNGNSGGNGSGGGNTGGDNSGNNNTETKPSAPTNVTCQNIGNSTIPQISITWSPVSNATSYKVYRSSSSSSGYSLLGSTTYTNYSDWEPMNGKNYYKIKAVNSVGESAYSSYTSYNHDPSSSLKPAPPTIDVSGTSTIYLSWSCTTNSSFGKPNEYKVYKRDPNTGDYELLTTTTSTSYSDRDSHPGINRYAVIAINNAGESGPGYGTSESVTLPRPSSFSASKSGSDVKFTWSKVDKATGYQIFSSSSANGTYYILDDISNGSTTSLTRYYPASSGTITYFKIKAYWYTEYGGSRIDSSFTSYKSVTF